MADLALEATVASNLNAKRTQRRRERDQRSGVRSYSSDYRGGSGYGSGGYRGGAVGKSRDDRIGGSRRDDGRDSTKVLISNLDYNVSEVDIKELFGEFGVTRKMRLNYDKSGRSVGSAEVIYEKRSDAMRAMQNYNGVPLDGKPMIIEVVSSYLGSADRDSSAAPRHYSRPVPYGNRNYQMQHRSKPTPQKTNDDKIEKTAEELDKELDQYLNSAGKTKTEPKSPVLEPQDSLEKELNDITEPPQEITAQEENDILGED